MCRERHRPGTPNHIYGGRKVTGVLPGLQNLSGAQETSRVGSIPTCPAREENCQEVHRNEHESDTDIRKSAHQLFRKAQCRKIQRHERRTGQDIAVVSEVRGTTTDPVYKSMELLPLGPVVMMDTPGIDDEGELGALRVKKSYQVLNKTDTAVLVMDGTTGVSREDAPLMERIRKKKIPYIIALNKKDKMSKPAVEEQEHQIKAHLELEEEHILSVSAADGTGIKELKERIARLAQKEEPEKYIVRDLIEPSDLVVLVVPIDKAAPKGRLILPQQQTIRDILEANAVSVVVKEKELRGTLERLGEKPKLVITDSQAFRKVAQDTPEDILLTSFSILFARYKGNLEAAVRGVTALDTLQDGDTILISEGCTHHRQCDDIGTVKIPRWIKEYTGKEIRFETTSGTEFPDELGKYKLVFTAEAVC